MAPAAAPRAFFAAYGASEIRVDWGSGGRNPWLATNRQRAGRSGVDGCGLAGFCGPRRTSRTLLHIIAALWQ
jgi:hypothetical protein